MIAPELSICIVNWNGRELLAQCLASIQAASQGLVVETIVVDNASTDGSAEMLQGGYPDVVLIRNQTNLGFARANNQAAAASRGEYLLFLNNDTIVSPNALRSMMRFMRSRPDVGMAGPRLIGLDGRPQRSYRYRPTLGALLHRLVLFRWSGVFRGAYQRYRRRGFDADHERQVEVLMGAAVCLPRSVFHQHGGWDERFPFGVEDIDLSTRVGGTHQLVYFPGAEILHRGRASTRKNAGFAYVSYECGYAHYVRKHLLGPIGVWGYKALLTLDLPLALTVEAFQAGWRRLRHGQAPPDKPHSDLAALWHFSTRGLPAFWKV